MRNALAILLIAGSTAHALINVRFTPADLTREARDICQVEVRALKDNAASVKFTGTLKGKAPAVTAFDLGEADDQTLENFPKAGGTGLLFTGDFSKAASNDAVGEKPTAMLQVGTQWFALTVKDGKWQIGKDPVDLSAVWGGSAAMLAECVKYCLADPRADVPTTAGAKFTSDEQLGTVGGKVTSITLLAEGKVQVGNQVWEFPAKKMTKTDAKPAGATTELITDYDGDGVLDKLVARADGPQLLRSQQTNITADTGELDYHSRSKPDIASAVDCDFNRDGRPDVLLVYGKGLYPLAFFNRGFGCFGLARELALQDSELTGAKALADGQQAATFVDVNGDGSPDLLAVAPDGAIWVLYTEPERKPGPSVTVTATVPLVVTAREGARSLGARRVAPGQPATFWMKNPGLLDLESSSGQKKRVIATKPVSVELDAGK